MDKVMDMFGVFDYTETTEGTYEYNASEIRAYFAGMVGNGVLKGIGNQFNASAAGLQVTIGTGEGWLLGVHGKMITTSTFTLDPVVSGMSKICSLVLDVDIPNQLFGISILAGTQAASPSAPQIIQSETRYQQVIWQARVHDDGTVTLSDCRVFLIRPGDGTTPMDIGAAGKSSLVTATLSASGWSGTSYALAVAGVTASSAVEVLPGLNVTQDQLEALQAANVQDGGQSAGSITLKAFGDVPTIDLPVRIIVRGDLY